MPLDALNDPGLLAARDRHFDRMRALSGGQQPDRPFFLNGCLGFGKCDPYVQPEQWVREAAEELVERSDRLLDEKVFRPLVIEYGRYGVHFIDSMFGARVYDLTGNGNWQAEPLDRPVGSLETPDLERDETWALARRAAKAFVDLGVSVPFFGLPTIACVLNIALNLYGQEMLVAFHESPDAVQHDLEVINNLLCTLHAWYRANVPMAQLQPVVAAFRTQPPGSGQICGCSTQLVSPEVYRRFIAPLDDQLLRVYPNPGMIHLCGAHAQHIPAWREMRSLRAVQLNDRAAEDLEVYWRELRDDQVFYVNPYPGMPVEEILRITGGRRVVIVAEPPA